MDWPMARYVIQVPRDVLSAEQKADVAKSVVVAHCEITGEDGANVQVVITEIDAGCFFFGGRLMECDHIFAHGYLAGSMTAERKQVLSTRLSADVTKAAEFDVDSTWVTITEL
jgi:phenylpyruvate tautomerase PptA (4-oxalocrotonate tautomerase family)